MKPDPALSTAGVVPRGLAYLVDCLCVFLVFAVTQLVLFVPLRSALGMSGDWFQSGWNTQLYTLLTISPLAWLYFSILESSSWQATIGKRLLGIRVQDSKSGARVPFPRTLLRTMLKLLPWEVAHLANNLPTPMWYTESPGFRIGFAISAILMAVYVLAIAIRNRHQSLYDSIAGTIVAHSNRPSATGTTKG